MIVGATELIVSIGTGAPARIDSSKKTNCSIGVRPLPPHSFGQPTPDPAVGGHLLPHRLRDRADALALAQVLFDLGRQQLVVVRAQLVAQRLVFLAQTRRT